MTSTDSVIEIDLAPACMRFVTHPYPSWDRGRVASYNEFQRPTTALDPLGTPVVVNSGPCIPAIKKQAEARTRSLSGNPRIRLSESIRCRVSNPETVLECASVRPNGPPAPGRTRSSRIPGGGPGERDLALVPQGLLRDRTRSQEAS
jgi:hypothetical protein